MNSPVRLGVSPATASTPTGVFNQRFEALFPRADCAVCFALPPFLPVSPCADVGSASCCTACPVPRQPLPCCESSPPLLLVWMNVSSLSPWLCEFHTVRFSVSSGCFLFLNCCCLSFGCARRRSVSMPPSWLEALVLFFIPL